MLGVNVFAADTDEEARLLFTSLQQAFVNLRRGRPGQLPPPVERLSRAARARGRRTCSRRCCRALWHRIGRTRCGAGWRRFVARTGADELMLTSQIFDHAARLRSYELAAGVLV